MLATAPTPRRAPEETVRLRPGYLPVKLLPKAITGFDGKTVRRYVDLSKIQRLPRSRSRWSDT